MGESVQLCPAITTWSEWTEFDLCSRSCGGGEKTRTRYNLCDMNQVETNTVACNEDPGQFVETGSRTPCSSNRCVQGTNSPILTHTCQRDANNNPVTMLGQPSVCYEPTAPAITRTAVGGCMAAVGVPAAACTRGLQQFIIKNECADLATVNPMFADQTIYEYCDVPATTPTEWTPFTACTKQCINAGEAAEVQTSQRLDECGNVEIRKQLCNVPSCASWQGWIVNAKCSCTNPGAAVVTRQCLDGYGQPAVGCVGQSTYQVPCGPNTSAQAVNPTTFALPQLSAAQLAEIKATMIDLGSWKQIAGQWSAFSGCAKTCDVSGVCGTESRYIESFCEDNDGNRVSIYSRAEARDCPCETGGWVVVADTCSSPDPMTCSGVRTVTKKHTCTGDQVTEQAGSCGTPGTWGAWSAYTQCRTSCQEAITPTRSRTRSWTCAAERLNGQFNDETRSLPAHRSSARTSEPGLRGLHALFPADWDKRPELDTATVVPSELDSASVITARSLEMKLLPAIWVIAASGTGPAGLDAAEVPTPRTSDSDSEETTADRMLSRSRSHVSLTTLPQVLLTLPARSSDRLVSTWSTRVNPLHG